MADYRAQLIGVPKTGDVARDNITNVLHYSAPTTTPASLGAAVLLAFTTNVVNYNNFSSLQIRIYDKSLPLHSPPVYTQNHSGGSFTAPGPRQVALCLSFYSGLNIRGQRGRIYIGPWAAADLAEYATAGQMTQLINLANALKHPGGADVIHQIWHPKTASWSNVSNYFVNNRWDTMRSRLPKETARQTSP